MGIENLNTAARAAGFAMAGSEETTPPPATKSLVESRELSLRQGVGHGRAAMARRSEKAAATWNFGWMLGRLQA